MLKLLVVIVAFFMSVVIHSQEGSSGWRAFAYILNLAVASYWIYVIRAVEDHKEYAEAKRREAETMKA